MSLEQIKNLREKTGAGMVEVKKALDEAEGNEEKALEILKKRGQEKALKKSDRAAGEGIVAAYIHSNGKVGAIVKLYCETDFVARNDEFKALAQDIAMHIVACNPKYLKSEEVSEETVAAEGRSREELALLTQAFVKNPDQTIQDLLTEKISKIGENIQIGEFARFEL